MAVQRISNVSLFNSTMNNVTSTQYSLYTLQQQISSGLKASTFQGLNGQVEQYIGLNAQTSRIAAFQQNNSVITSRLQTADKALDNITDAASDIANLIVQRRGAVTSDNLNFAQQLKDKLQQVADSLNTQIDGRYLFSGTATNTVPVPDSTVGSVAIGVADANYYKGSTQDVSMRIDDGVDVDFPVRADDVAFQQIFAAVNLALQPGANDATYAQAYDMIQKGQQNLTSAQARVNSTVVNVNQISQKQDQMKLYLQGVTESVAKTDIVSTTTKVANDQAILQASYQVFARLVQLKLSDYL